LSELSGWKRVEGKREREDCKEKRVSGLVLLWKGQETYCVKAVRTDARLEATLFRRVRAAGEEGRGGFVAEREERKW
jgi:hypothetical protein